MVELNYSDIRQLMEWVEDIADSLRGIRNSTHLLAYPEGCHMEDCDPCKDRYGSAISGRKS